ncbi:probable RNA helicase SDE3 isoform X2 [Cornus florida]|uniref:probable RNA helicase SDE3 isoform X2 n=1 Tax=Cornus florida TaxID=4283 RepID=UPI0028A0776C|nr:probable RNA helicase SDE3 isoform X2 [Cornus florida]
MPQFLDILRCILCCNDEDDEETRNRNTYCELDRPVITQSHAQTDYDTFRSRFPPTYHCSTSSKSPPPTSSSTSSGTHSSSSKPPPPTNKPTLTKASPNLTNQQTKTNYVRVDKGASPIYVIPEDIKSLIEKDIVPGVLRKPLSASTYKDYFEALLYAEDYYHEGIIYRVVKSNLVLVEFGEDFHSQHYSACKYTVKFSFNRVCLKRAHQAIAASSDPLFLNFLFPDVPRNSLTAFQVLPINHKLDAEKVSAVRQILGLKSPPPYLVEGSPSVTGMVVKEAVVQIYRSSPSCRILICAPINRTCDVLMRGLKKEIPESELFRANAAFRELDEVPPDILTSCPLKGECFSCPSLQELQKFKVILSTFMSSFRLHNEGIMAGHFSHIFLVDASSATEPETMVVLANLANEKTAVVITGAPWRHSSWVRSKIARENGLMTSYFERLCESKLYESLNPKFITRLQD